MRTKTSLKKGFTLIEIMIVVVIIGILAVALFPKLLGAISKSADAGRVAGLKSMTAVLLQYKADTGSYPATAGCTRAVGTAGYGGLKDLIDGGYMDESKMPADPNKNVLTYGSCTGGFYYAPIPAESGADAASSYILVARMDDAKKGNVATVPSGGDRASIAPTLTLGTGRFFVELGL